MNKTAYLWLLVCLITVSFICLAVIGGRNEKRLQAELNDVTAILMKQVHTSSYPIEIMPLDTISPILVYRYPEFSCSICYQDDLDLLRSLKNEIGADHICILPAYRKDRDNEILLRNELAGFNFFNVEFDNEIPLFEVDGIIHRYFAVYENNVGFRMIFFPDRKYSELTKYYLREIQAKYFSAE